ncbi:MAG: hypothetical protein GC162_14850 [Planctomycetes bacterium]|nr:hypothetical protein [Planctomycetota bacterium]
MSLILDAYNVLHCSHVLPERYASINALQLAAMLDRSNFDPGRLIVVCDGNPKPDEDLALCDIGRAELLHSGKSEEADDVIERLIDADTSPRKLTVVSNDHRIQRAAKRRRARVLSCETFLNQLARAFARYEHQQHAKPRPPMPNDPDAWMKKFGLTGHEPPPADLDTETDRWLKEFGLEDDDDD